jgi:hypothetical protein
MVITKRQAVGINVLDYRAHRERWANLPKTKAAASRLRLSLPSVFAAPVNDSEAVAFGNEANHRSWGDGRWDFHSDPALGPKRLPSWLLWDRIYRQGSRAKILFPRADGTVIVETAQSLLGGYFKQRGSLEKTVDPRRYVIGMPESFKEEHQELLLRYLPWGRTHTQLLWRSVAAILGASAVGDELGVSLLKSGDQVLVIDLQNEYLEASVLKIVDSDSGAPFPSNLVPIRSVPSSDCYMRVEHVPFDMVFGLRLFGEELGFHAEDYLNFVWGLDGLARLSDPNFLTNYELLISSERGLHKRVLHQRELSDTAERVLACNLNPHELDMISRMKELVGLESSCETSVLNGLSKVCFWAAGLGNMPRKILLSGTVSRLIGTLSNDLDVFKPALAPLVSRGAVVLNKKLDPQRDLIAAGCAHWGALDESGYPGYFEYLEPFAIIGRGPSGKKVQYSLLKLDNDECLATGGKEYRNTDLKDIALIHKGQPFVRFWFRKGDEHKKVDQFFVPPPAADCRLSFDITMVSSQGYAKVEIIPDVPDVFKGRRLLLDWDRMVELTDSEMQGQMSYPTATPLDPDPYRHSRKINLVKDYVKFGKMGKNASLWTPADQMLGSLGKALQSGRVLGSDPSNPLVEDFVSILDSHFRQFRNYGPEDWESDELGRALLRTASSLFHRTPSWAKQILFDHLIKKRSEDPDNPRPQVVLLNCCGRCFSSEEEVQLYVKAMIARFSHQLDEYKANPGSVSVGMDNWCRGLQIILRINEETNLFITLEQAEKLQYLLRCLIEFERTRNANGPQRPGVSRPCQNAMLSIFYLLRVRGRGDGGGFLAPGTEAMEAIKDAVQSVNAGMWKWVPPGVSVGEDDSFQESLLKFIGRTATMKDLRIIASGEDEILE